MMFDNAEVLQSLVGFRNASSTLHEKLSTPPPPVPVPPPPPEQNESYPEDQKHRDDETCVDPSLSINEMSSCLDRQCGPEAVLDS